MKCAPKKDKGISVLIWSWSQQALAGKRELQEAFSPLKVNGFSCLTDHLGSIWDALGTVLLCLLKETDDAEKAVPAQCKTSSTDKILHLFHFSFFENLEFHLYFRRPRVMLYLSPNRILEFQWSLSRQKFSRIVFKGKGNFSLSEKQCFSQRLK